MKFEFLLKNIANIMTSNVTIHLYTESELLIRNGSDTVNTTVQCTCWWFRFILETGIGHYEHPMEGKLFSIKKKTPNKPKQKPEPKKSRH